MSPLKFECFKSRPYELKLELFIRKVSNCKVGVVKRLHRINLLSVKIKIMTCLRLHNNSPNYYRSIRWCNGHITWTKSFPSNGFQNVQRFKSSPIDMVQFQALSANAEHPKEHMPSFHIRMEWTTKFIAPCGFYCLVTRHTGSLTAKLWTYVDLFLGEEFSVKI